MFLLTRKRLAWLATCAMFVACASAPDPKPTKRKKKKRKKDSIAFKSKKDRDDADEDKPRKNKNDDDDEPDKSDSTDDEVTIIDESDDESSRPTKKKDDKKKKKKEEPVEQVASKKKKKEEPADEPVEEVASKKKKKKEEPVDEPVEEVASKKKKKKQEPVEEPVEEEVAAKPKKKKEDSKVAAKDKKKKAEPEPEPDIEIEEPPDEPEPTKVAAKSKKKDTKKQTADVDMTAPAEDENVIEMGEEPERVEDAPPDRRGVAIAVPGVDDEDTGEEDTTPIGSNPLSINERPLVLAKSKLGIHGGLRVNVLTLETMPGMKTSTTSESFALGVNYGVGDSSEVGLDYTLGLNPSSAKGPLTIHGAYSASASAKLDVAIAAALAIDFSGTTDPTTMQTTNNTLLSLQLGAWARYRINRKLSAFTGIPATPNSASSLSKLSFPLPPLPYQLVIGVNNAGTIALDVPVGVGYQGSPKLYVFGMLDLAHIRVANTENAFIFADFIPLVLGGFYAFDKLDVGVQFADDLKQGTDYLRFDLLARYSIK